ncbi:MAG: ROK family protein [Nanoarchaeota archaeon]|nr:ROK family protein [Nanoarchaeota archaeon]MBU4451637.1 ROK family protein [Nanoarchaeota archaeon]MCG2724074.1 ROK family protein [archaeon]
MMYSIAIDFGGTKIKGAIVDGKGKIYTTCRIPTEAQKGSGRIIANLTKVIKFLSDSFETELKAKREAPARKMQADFDALKQKLKLPSDSDFLSHIELPQIRMPKEIARLQLKKSDMDVIFRAFELRITGVGISMPGFTDKCGKVIFGGGTLTSLVGINLKKDLEERVKFPVFIENDANCFALAEAVHGAGKRHNIVLGVIWGTGIGGGLVIERRIYSGAFKDGLEFGHMVIDPTITSGVRCGCGQYGCLEMLASGKNISRRYYEFGGKLKNAGAREVYLSREPAAKKALADAIHYLGIGLADLVNAFNPEVIVMGGSVSRFPNSVYGRLKKEVKKYALPMLTKNLHIVRYKISADEGILGAAEVVRYSTQPRIDEAAYDFSKSMSSVKTFDDFKRILRERGASFDGAIRKLARGK